MRSEEVCLVEERSSAVCATPCGRSLRKARWSYATDEDFWAIGAGKIRPLAGGGGSGGSSSVVGIAQDRHAVRRGYFWRIVFGCARRVAEDRWAQGTIVTTVAGRGWIGRAGQDCRTKCRQQETKLAGRLGSWRWMVDGGWWMWWPWIPSAPEI